VKTVNFYRMRILTKLNIFFFLNGRRGTFLDAARVLHVMALSFFILFAPWQPLEPAAGAENPKKKAPEPARVPAPAPVDNIALAAAAKTHLKKIADSCAPLQKYLQGREHFQSFYSDVKQIGEARAIEIDGAVSAYELPLIAGDYTARFIYLDSSGRLLFPPASNASGSRYFLTSREWKEIAAANYSIPSSFAPVAAADRPDYFPYYLNDRHQNLVELCGIPAGQEALADFKTIDYLAEMPSKSIGKRKMTMLSLAGSEIGEFIPLKSFSYAAAYCADWWHIAASCSNEIVFERYRDFLSEKPAFGIDPRAVEMIYVKRAESESGFFKFSSYMKDPLFVSEKIPESLEAYASVLVLPETASAEDAADRKKIYSIDENNKFYMGEEYIELFRGHEGSSETLVSALETHGIVLAGISFYMKGVPLYHSAKAVAVVGYKKTAGTTLFIYKDFEDPAKMFRIAPVSLFGEAYCFSHEFRAKARYIVKKRKLMIETFNHKGNNIDVDSISAVFPVEGRRVKFLKEARGVYFHQVKKEDFSGVDRAKLTAEIRKKYFVSGDNEFFTVRYAIY